MIQSLAFQTRARTVDHLGREQIADCPTAISELWKNAYDAYASGVELHIFDAQQAVAAILDDGHGMNYEEFVERWLVVGTESKFGDQPTPEEDRNGLEYRSRQGQKGIGRLSSANLGPLFLLVSKRKRQSFVAALIDWRIFENPYLVLSDIKIPVTSFEKKEQLFDLLPNLFDKLMDNIWGGHEDEARKQRIELAWQSYDAASVVQEPQKKIKPSEAIAQTVINTCFEARHLEAWPLWQGEKDQGTAMLISEVNYDLSAHLDERADEPLKKRARERFVETLSSFVDPFWDPKSPDINSCNAQFSYAVWAHSSDKPRLVVGSDREFDRRATSELEHVLEGSIDEQGVFRGQVKVFGQWKKLGAEYVIEPPKDLKVHTRKDWKVGPVDLYIAAFEQTRNNTTLSPAEFDHFTGMAERYAGFLVFRNGLRLLPYGRVDNDFFEIETRRSKHAGREFWNSRRMFGRVGLSRENNPNLKDKAGREGFIDNVAAKTLKELVENILHRAARDYFGTDADTRKEILPDVQAANEKAKANEARNKLRKKQRKQFRSQLKKMGETLPELVESLEGRVDNLKIESESDILDAQESLDEIRTELGHYKLPGAPAELGNLEKPYSEYRDSIASANRAVSRYVNTIEAALERIKPAVPAELLEKQLNRNAAQIHARIKRWKSSIAALQKHENVRIAGLIEERNKRFHAEARPLVEECTAGSLSLQAGSARMEALRLELDTANAELFESYIRAQESLTESIDLELLAMADSEEYDAMRSELDRLNGLAQLGITVEILGHELQSYDDMIGHGIRQLPESVQASKAVEDIRSGYDGLTNQLRFLSPLKLSGQKIQKWISGEDIVHYIQSYFAHTLAQDHISLNASPEFLACRIYEQPSRLYPVFINLVNNSRYWLSVSEEPDKRIRLEARANEVTVSDNGPGVEDLDVAKLFSLFFTRKLRGGRGVGLYLARANLAAGGHSIRYLDNKESTPLPGANFVITFKGMDYDG